MATVVYSYQPNDVVFYVPPTSTVSCDGVREAVVRTVNIVHKTTGITISYDVAFTKTPGSTATALEVDLFPDIDSALAEYKIRLTA